MSDDPKEPVPKVARPKPKPGLPKAHKPQPGDRLIPRSQTQGRIRKAPGDKLRLPEGMYWVPQHMFARVRRAELACPHCGALDELGPACKRWHKGTQTWRCPSCSRVYAIGLVLWEQGEGVKSRGPEDCTFTLEDCESLRSSRQSVAVMQAEGSCARKPHDPVNLLMQWEMAVTEDKGGEDE